MFRMPDPNCGLVLVCLAALGCGAPARQPEPLWPALYGGPEAALEREVELRHVELDLELDPLAERIHGSVTVWVRALGRGARELRLVGPGVREVLDSAGHSLELRGPSGALTVVLAEELAPGQEIPLKLRFAAERPDGVAFGETAVGPGWSPWVSAGPAGLARDGVGPRPWFPCVDPQGACCSIEARVRVGHGMVVLLAGLPWQAQPEGGLGADGVRSFHFRSEERLSIARLALAAARLEAVGDGPRASRVWLPEDATAGLGRGLVDALAWRESALRARLGEAEQPDRAGPAGASGLEPWPPMLVQLPSVAGQRLDGLGVIALGPALAQRLGQGGTAGPLDPLALALARQRVEGRVHAARPSEAWLLEGLAAYLALAIQGGEAPDDWQPWAEAAPAGDPEQRALEALAGADGRGIRLSATALGGLRLFDQLGEEFGREPLLRAVAHALATRKGAGLGSDDLARAFQQLDGQDPGPRLGELARRPGPLSKPRVASDSDAKSTQGLGLNRVQLVEAASRSGDPLERAAAIRRLPAAEPGMAELLLQILGTAPDANLRTAALAALWDHAEGDVRLRGELRNLAVRETDLAVRAAYGFLLPRADSE